MIIIMTPVNAQGSETHGSLIQSGKMVAFLHTKILLTRLTSRSYFVSTVFEASPDQPSAPKPCLLPVGAVDFSATASSEQQSMLSAVMTRLSQRVSQRRILVKPCFQDFDRFTILLPTSCSDDYQQ